MFTISLNSSLVWVNNDKNQLTCFTVNDFSAPLIHFHGHAASFLNSLSGKVQVGRLSQLHESLWKLKAIVVSPAPVGAKLVLEGKGWSITVEEMDESQQAFAQDCGGPCPPGYSCEPMTANWCDPWTCVS